MNTVEVAASPAPSAPEHEDAVITYCCEHSVQVLFQPDHVLVKLPGQGWLRANSLAAGVQWLRERKAHVL